MIIEGKEPGPRPGESAFLADLGQKDRQIWRLLVSIPAGAAMAFVLAMIVMLPFMIVFMMLLADRGMSIEEISEFFPNLVEGKIERTLVIDLSALLVLVAANTAAFVGFVWVSSMLFRRRMRRYFTGAPRFRWRAMILGLTLFTLVLGPLVPLELMFDPEMEAKYPVLTLADTLAERALYAVSLVVLLLFASMAEEVLFRGWLLKQLAAFTRNAWILIPINAVLFSAIHMDFDPTAFLARAIMGAAFCYMALRLSGIEFAIGAHAANNILIMMFIDNVPLKIPEPKPFDPMALIPMAVLALGLVAITEIAWRVKPLRRWARLDVEPAGG